MEVPSVLKQPVPEGYLLGALVPASFALLVSTIIRIHSLSPVPTLPRAVGLLLSVAGLALLVLLLNRSRLRLAPDFAVLLFALAASASISVLGSGDVEVSMLRMQLYLALGLLATAVYLTYRDREGVPVQAFLFAISLVHLPFLVAVVWWISGQEPPFWQDGFRVAHFANVRHFGYLGFLAAASGLAIGLLSPRLKGASLVLATAALSGVILTGSRAGLLSWLLFVLLACCLSKTRWQACLYGALVLAVSAGLVWFLDWSGLLATPNIFGRIADLQSGVESFDTSRIKIWSEAIRQIAARPFFGSGPEGYVLSRCCDSRVLQAHNFVLQFLLEFGVVGCGIALALVSRVYVRLGGMRALLKLFAESQANRLLACLLAAFLAFGLIDQVMYHLVPLLHFAVLTGLFAAGLAQARRSSTQMGT